jgi:hypothetical protein
MLMMGDEEMELLGRKKRSQVSKHRGGCKDDTDFVSVQSEACSPSAMRSMSPRHSKQ